MAINLVPAAQYLRMSTEHQQYSFVNQSAAIQQYAENRGFVIVRTYSDAARSGVVLRRRPGLRELIQHVVSGSAEYRAVLVYDVSRWGRFQDVDESAHYEFLCKSAGIPVHYCAEIFPNDGSAIGSIMKSLKRMMAGEYSRELGVKILAGQKRITLLGFKQGGVPGYGLRRMLVSPDRQPKQILETGERKSILTDRVTLVPGPPAEVQTIHDIYRMLVDDRRTVHAISRELNHRGIKGVNGRPWNYSAVYKILTHPKYTGCNVFGRTSSRLYTPVTKLPKSQWTLAPDAFEPLVDEATFQKAQQILEARTIRKTDEELLSALKDLLASRGMLSLSLIKRSGGLPSLSAYRSRFGGIRQAYALIGYDRPELFDSIDVRCRTQHLREQLVQQMAVLFPNNLTIVRRNGKWRSQLRFQPGGLLISVLIGRHVDVWKNSIRWRVYPVPHERRDLTLLARLKEGNSEFLDYYILPNTDQRSGNFLIRLDDPYLHWGLRLNTLGEFQSAVQKMRMGLRKGTR